MARHQKVSLDYFPMDCVNNDAMKLIEAKYGVEGFAVIIKLYQRIYGTNGYFCDWSEDARILFANETHTNLTTIDKIIGEAAARGIFDKEIYETHSVLTSQFIQNTYFDAAERRGKVNVKEELLLIEKSDLPQNVYINGINVSRNEINVDTNPENVYKSTQSKVNKRKENKTKENKTRVKESESNDAAAPDAALQHTPPSYDEVASYARKNRYAYTDIERFYEYYSAKGWPITGWQSTLDRWAKTDEEEYFRKTEEEFRRDSEWQSFATTRPSKSWYEKYDKMDIYENGR